MDTSRERWLPIARDAALVVGALALATALVYVLESVVALPDASPAYLLAVVAVAVVAGTIPAVLTAVGAFLSYDFLFTDPRFTFRVADATEWVTLLLLLVVGIVVGRLAGRERDRAESASAGEREARALFGVSRTLATAPTTAEALPAVLERLREDTRMSRVWVTDGDASADRIVADSHAGAAAPTIAVHDVLSRKPGDEPATWVRVHAPARVGRSDGRPAELRPTDSAYRVTIDVDGATRGSIWALRSRKLGPPIRGENRVLAAAADQIGRSMERDRLLQEATSAEVVRRGDALKSALLDSVSHDLRTPLASIRAAAGTLMDPDVSWPADERRQIAASIDREAERLNRLVSDLLDMTRIEAGELRPDAALFALRDLVDDAVARLNVVLHGREVRIDVADSLPPVLVDEVFIGQVLTNVLDNAAKYAGPSAVIAVSAVSSAGASSVLADATPRVIITIDDDGPGVPDEALPRLFDKFYRVPRSGEGARRGTGMGLAVVRGLTEAMGGTVEARRGMRGGLAVDVTLRAGRAPELPR